MGLRIVMVWWGVILRLLLLMRIIRCGVLMVVRLLIRRWRVVWVVLACWVLARWACVVPLGWVQPAWVGARAVQDCEWGRIRVLVLVPTLPRQPLPVLVLVVWVCLVPRLPPVLAVLALMVLVVLWVVPVLVLVV